jgi:hypothetical protein
MTTATRAVFIGGSSQSGTSTLNRYMSAHPDVLACPLETCFIVAAHGLVDVVRAVSDEYCFFRLDPILHDFDRLMRHDLCSPRSYPFNRFDLTSFFGAQRFHTAVEEFYRRLGVSRYAGDGLTIGPLARFGKLHTPYKFKHWWFPAALARERDYLYHAERLPRPEGVDAARQLLDDLFGATARAQGKRIWCEQTSTNQVFAAFLLELCPDGLHINTVRDPLDVALAHQAQSWTPEDFEMICQTLRSVYERSFEQRVLLAPSQFIETRFERLAEEPESELPRICAAIGITYTDAILVQRPDLTRLNAERRRRQSADLTVYRRLLGPIAERLGYPVP